MASNNDLRTRAGISPNEAELPFSITTRQVEDYLQRKLDVVMNRGGNGETREPIEVRVYTTEAGKSFLPFVVVLPMDVLEETGKKNKNKKKMAAIFDTKSCEGTSNMRPEYYNLFSSYIYTKDDESAFFSDDWRRARRVNRETSPVLKGLRTPKVTTMNDGALQVVSFMIDPLRVFHDMLKMEGDNRSFKVEVQGWQKIQTGEYRYDVLRAVTKGKRGKKYRDTVADELNRKMRGNR